MNKQKIIAAAEKILVDAGFERRDYVISLQGPTIFFSGHGEEKIKTNPATKIQLVHAGMIVHIPD